MAAVLGEMGRPYAFGPIVLMGTPCGSRISRTRCGSISIPPLAMAAPTSAIWSGLAVTSCCPIAEKARPGVLSGTCDGLGKFPVAKGTSNGTWPSKPNFLAWS